MAEQKTYVPRSSAKEITFQTSGKTILKLSFKASEFVEFIKSHTNAKGYLNLGVSARRETGPYGDTHCVWLDTWQPKAKTDQPEKTSGYIPPEPETPAKEDDIPF